MSCWLVYVIHNLQLVGFLSKWLWCERELGTWSAVLIKRTWLSIEADLPNNFKNVLITLSGLGFRVENGT